MAKSLFAACFFDAAAAHNLKQDPQSTFGFALSCNFYERPNVSERMENDYFHVSSSSPALCLARTLTSAVKSEKEA